MILVDAQRERLAAELLAALEAEAGLLQHRLAQIARLSQAILHPAPSRLEEVLAEMEQTHRDQQKVDERLESARSALAAAMGRPARELTLSKLAQRWEGPQRRALEERRRQLLHLTRIVRHENYKASVLLSESARINRLILERLWPGGQSVTTYNAGGAEAWRSESGLFEAQL